MPSKRFLFQRIHKVSILLLVISIIFSQEFLVWVYASEPRTFTQTTDQEFTAGGTFNDTQIEGTGEGAFVLPSMREDWYDSDWLYRIPLIIDADKIDSNLSDFPVYVDLSLFCLNHFMRRYEVMGGISV